MQDAELVEQPPYAFHTSKLSLTRGIVCGNLWGSVLLLVTRATYYLVLVRQPPWHYDQGDTNLCNETKSPVPTLVPQVSEFAQCLLHALLQHFLYSSTRAWRISPSVARNTLPFWVKKKPSSIVDQVSFYWHFERQASQFLVFNLWMAILGALYFLCLHAPYAEGDVSGF